MYLLSDSYLALVSFVSGCDAATEGSLLSGFDAWAAERTEVGETSLAWPTIVAARHWPAILEGGWSIEELPSSLQEGVRHDLMQLLDAFLAERDNRSTT